MKKDISIATVSLIRTLDEKKVVLETIAELSKLDIPVVIVDGGSDENDIAEIKEFKNVLLFNEKGLYNQLLRSQREASNISKSIFYLQTDKLELVKNYAKKLIGIYQEKGEGVLIPVRNNESISSYPYYQKISEEFLNFFISDFIGYKTDYFAGPKIYPSSFVAYLDKLKEDIGWGIEAYYYAIAKRQGLPFYYEEVYSPSPVDIDDETRTKDYRLKIVEWQIRALLLGKEVEL